jgi:hypothetical protein
VKIIYSCSAMVIYFIIYLWFNNAVCIVLNERIIDESWTGNDMEGSGCDLI